VIPANGSRLNIKGQGITLWVIVDLLTKVAHFIPVKETYKGARLAELI